MKNLVKISNNFGFIDLPDNKVYTINELKNCVIPPIYILYEHQIYSFDKVTDSYIWRYKSVLGESSFSASTEKKVGISPAFYLTYDPYTQTIVNAITIEDYLNNQNNNSGNDNSSIE